MNLSFISFKLNKPDMVFSYIDSPTLTLDILLIMLLFYHVDCCLPVSGYEFYYEH